MKKLNLIALVFTLLFVTASSGTAEAQRPAHYVPARPTFSNYLLYRQVNATGVPNYYSYVRPAQQSREFLSNARVSALRGGRQSLSVDQAVARVLESKLTERLNTGIGQPSVPAQFGNTSHFYRRPPVQQR